MLVAADIITIAAIFYIGEYINAFTMTCKCIGIFAIHHDILARAVDAFLIAATGIGITAATVHRIGLYIDACIVVATSLALDTAFVTTFQIIGSTCERLAAGFARFTAIGWVMVAIEVTALAFAATANTEHIVAAGSFTIATMLGIAHQIEAYAVAQRIVVGAANHTFPRLARFIFFAFGIAVAAVIRIALNIDAIAHAVFLVI